MGFREYSDFNQAMLAKQGWRMVTNPESLCARVLKARYFRGCTFLEAGCPKRASFTWRSILHGRELLKAGLIWRIGDGSKVSIWKDNWIPRAGAQRPLGRRDTSEIELVSELMIPGGGAWDVEKLQEVFFEADARDIAHIPVERTGTMDYLTWNYTKKGYSVSNLPTT